MRTLAFRSLLLVTILVSSTGIVSGQTVDSEWLQGQTDQLLKKASLIGAGATVLVDGKVIASTVSGRRRANSDVPLTINDKWHVGSITKSMTATVTARLIERGLLSWDSRLPELLPNMAKDFHEGWNEVTLLNLLTHSAGLPANFPVGTQFLRTTEPGPLHEHRRTELAKILTSAPASKPGETMTYSNVGYTLVGFIAAEKAGMTWELLMEKELFAPLELNSAGFGPPIGKDPVDQPWGHQRALFVRTPMDPKGFADNSPVIGPAGIVHMSMNDLARYGWEHLRGESEDTALLKSESFRKLHQGMVKDYACGWLDWQRDWADGRVIWHNGSNTFWYALVTLVPSRNAVIVVVTNDGNISKAQPEFLALAETTVKQLPATVRQLPATEQKP